MTNKTNFTGLYAGSFDPFTIGHLAIACKALDSYDQLIIGVGRNPSKKGLFSEEERVKLIKSTIDDFIESYDKRHINGKKFSINEINVIKKLKTNPNIVKVLSYEGLTIDCAIKNRASALVRGERLSGDTESEQQLEKMNDALGEIRGVHIKTDRITVPKTDLTYISSSSCRTLCEIGEYIAAEKYVTSSVHNALMSKYLQKEFIRLGQHFGLDEKDINVHYNKLINQYSKNRYHHNLSHIAYGINHINIYNNLVKKIPNTEILKTAYFFHDFVNKGEKNDEELSAKAALSFFSKKSKEEKDLVYKYIMATKHLEIPNQKMSLEEKIICDIDLAILGDSNNFGSYSQNIRKEYKHFNDEKYTEGRIKVLDKFINKKNIFKTEYFSRFNDTANDNLFRERNHWLGIRRDLIPLKRQNHERN